jgi:hypothetical protein
MPEHEPATETPSTVVGAMAEESTIIRLVERRACVRYSCAPGVETFCLPVYKDRNDQGWLAEVRNISTDGIGLLLGRWFGQETLLEVELQNAARSVSRKVLVRVKHATSHDGGWLVGGILVQKLSEAELRAFL